MHARILRCLLAGAVFGLCATADAGAQPTGFLDDRFFGDGTITVAAGLESSSVRAVVEAPDGRLVAAGARSSIDGQNTLFWQAFGDSAASTLCSPAAPAGGLFASARALAFDSSGRLLVAGTASYPTTGYDAMILRFLYPACTLDTSFSGDGVQYFALNQFEHLYDLAIDSQGRIVAAGDIFNGGSQQDLLVVRLLSNGSPDNSWSANGRVEIAWGPGSEFGRLVLQADDRVVAGGTIDGGVLGTMFVVARFAADGTLDPTFAGDGELAFDFPFGEDDRLSDLAIDPVSGSILAAGSSDDDDSGTTRSVVARLLSTGALDPDFDGDGRWEDNVFDLESIARLELQSDGRILIAGDAANVGDNRDFFAYRLHPNGGIDSSYGFFGVTAAGFDLGGTDDDLALAATLQSGALVIAGSADLGSQTVGAVARFWSDLIFADGFERDDSTGWSASAP